MEPRFTAPLFSQGELKNLLSEVIKARRDEKHAEEKRGGRLKTFPGYLALSLDPCFTVKMADERDKMRCKIMRPRKTNSKQFSNKQQQRGRHFYQKNAITERVNEKCDETKLGVLAPLEILADFPKLKCCGLL